MLTRCRYFIESFTPECITISDIGHEGQTTVTNDAEAVVEELTKLGYLATTIRSDGTVVKPRLMYYDSLGNLHELLHDGNGNFCGFDYGGIK